MSFNKKTVKDVEIIDKKVLVRCDFNVPIDEKGKITDNRRIIAALPTIKFLMDKKNKVILCSHLGRPEGEWKDEFSLQQIVAEISKNLGKKVEFVKDIVGQDAKKAVDKLKPGEVLLLENLRFDPREEKNDKEFSKELASLAEFYVNDAFGTAHRAHSSTAGVAEFLPSVAGFLMEKEINYLGRALEEPERPYIALLGGKKVSDKIQVISSLLDKVDSIIIGGGMAIAFYKAMGLEIGNSFFEEGTDIEVEKILDKAKEKKVKILLPVDLVLADSIDSKNTEIVEYTKIPKDKSVFDIGPETINNFVEELNKAKTIFWNGPMGVFEKEQFSKGTEEIATAIADINCISIVGGGDSAAAVEKLELDKEFSHISTGGGASLEFIEGKKLPGIEVLEDK